jgi:2-dehydropantoate 2-reductase
MKVAIIGLGAMGSIYAALFAATGYEVIAYDPWVEHVDAINKNGLSVDSPKGDYVVKNIQASSVFEAHADCNLYVIATKASGVESAARKISPLLGPNTTVITIQNGLGAEEKLSKHIGREHIILGVAEGFGASVKKPGHVHHNAMKLIRLGELTGEITERLTQLTSHWIKAGFNVQAYQDIQKLIWEKFLCNVTFSAPCTVFEKTLGELMDDTSAWPVALGAMYEAYKIGIAKKVDFSFDDPVEYVSKFGENLRNARPSMFLDHLANKRSEIMFINGKVPSLGREVGIPTPFNDTLAALVINKEKKFMDAT